MKELRTIALVLVHLLCISIWGQYNPTNPAEPGTAPWTLTLTSDPIDAGSFNISKVTNRAAGATITITANDNGNFKFKVWEDENGNTLSTKRSFNYTMPAKNVKLVARYIYNPSSPNEPSVPIKYGAVKLSVSPSDGGSVSPSGTNKYEVESNVTLYAYNNSNFVFVNWTKDGEVISIPVRSTTMWSGREPPIWWRTSSMPLAIQPNQKPLFCHTLFIWNPIHLGADTSIFPVAILTRRAKVFTCTPIPTPIMLLRTGHKTMRSSPLPGVLTTQCLTRL